MTIPLFRNLFAKPGPHPGLYFPPMPPTLRGNFGGVSPKAVVDLPGLAFVPCPNYPGEFGTAAFINTYTGAGSDYHPGAWNTINLRSTVGLPAEAQAIAVSALLIISNGYTQELADLMVTWRKTGYTQDVSGGYQWQVISPWAGGGQRSTAFGVVQLNEGCFDLWYNIKPVLGTWPTRSAYGLNVSIQGYYR